MFKKLAVVSQSKSVVNLLRNALTDFSQVFFASDIFTFGLLLKKFPEIPVLIDCNNNFLTETEMLPLNNRKFYFTEEISAQARTQNILLYPGEVLSFIRKNCSPGKTDNSSEEERKPSVAFSKICGISDAVKKLRKKIEMAALSDVPVLLVGESGCGKTLAANAIHELSERHKNHIYSVNISGLNDSLVESELFGNVKGAYTDAMFRKGYFESAEGSTLFLDEIGDISLNVQKKLLHVIENSEYRKVGSDEVQQSDVRLIFATNANLEEKVAAQEFRQDLYYRIKKIVIKVPALDDRKEDIPEICRNYLSERYPKKFLAEKSEAFLKNCSWPGNIRQLESCLDRAALFCPSDEISPAFLEP